MIRLTKCIASDTHTEKEQELQHVRPQAYLQPKWMLEVITCVRMSGAREPCITRQFFTHVHVLVPTQLDRVNIYTAAFRHSVALFWLKIFGLRQHKMNMRHKKQRFNPWEPVLYAVYIGMGDPTSKITTDHHLDVKKIELNKKWLSFHERRKSSTARGVTGKRRMSPRPGVGILATRAQVARLVRRRRRSFVKRAVWAIAAWLNHLFCFD